MRPPVLDSPLSDAVPHIFKRPLLQVGPGDPLLKVATFLAIGPQIYVDGIAVLDGNNLVGTIGGQHLIRYILHHEEDWLQATAQEVMAREPNSISASSTLAEALDIFGATRFAYLPVIKDSRVVASLSIRDVVRAVSGSTLKVPIAKIASRLVSVRRDTSIRKALDVMLEKRIRNLALEDGKRDSADIVNDRKVLEFILSHEGYAVKSGDLEADVIETIDVLRAKCVRKDLKASDAATLLSGVDTPCLVLRGARIVTPWDIVMKAFRKR